VQFAWPSLKNEEEFADVKAKLIKGLGIFSSDALITGIYRDSSSKGQARQQAFERQKELTREARGDANVQYAWHGTSKTGVSGIMLHGFGQPRTPKNGSAYGVGVYLAPENHADVRWRCIHAYDLYFFEPRPLPSLCGPALCIMKGRFIGCMALV
jgi:hypothetical protein